ncbi:MAG: hypothetical protein AAGJ08_01750 [Cyanobacteria bacterium P01_H01_bin.35]
MSGSIGIASEKVRKKEEGRSRGDFLRNARSIPQESIPERKSPLQEKEKPYMAVDISPTFTQTIPTDIILQMLRKTFYNSEL